MSILDLHQFCVQNSIIIPFGDRTLDFKIQMDFGVWVVRASAVSNLYNINCILESETLVLKTGLVFGLRLGQRINKC